MQSMGQLEACHRFITITRLVSYPIANGQEQPIHRRRNLHYLLLTYTTIGKSSRTMVALIMNAPDSLVSGRHQCPAFMALPPPTKFGDERAVSSSETTTTTIRGLIGSESKALIQVSCRDDPSSRSRLDQPPISSAI